MDRLSSQKKRLYTLKEGATFLGMGVHGVRGLVWAGELPVVKRSGNGRKFFLDLVDLESWIEGNKKRYSR